MNVNKKKCKHKNTNLIVLDAFDIHEVTAEKCKDCNQIIKNTMDNLQDNLKCLITDEVINGQRIFKLVDGTKPLKTAHVFDTVKVKNLGNTEKDEIAMGKIANENYCAWYAKNRNAGIP